MTSFFSFPAFIALGLIALAALSQTLCFFLLPLLALATLVASTLNARYSTAWRWAGLGSFLWLLEESYWLAVRQFGAAETTSFTDVLFFGGALAWLIALQLMPRRRRSDTGLLLATPILLFLVVVLLQNVSLSLRLSFPFAEFALFLFSLPLIEAAVRNRASQGFLLLALGFFVRALTATLYAWLGDVMIGHSLALLLWVTSYTLLALGSWAIFRGAEQDAWPSAYATLILLLSAGLSVLITYPALGPSPLFIAFIAFLCYSVFIILMLFMGRERRRKQQTEKEFDRWSYVLERLLKFQPDPRQVTLHPRIVLQDMLRTLKIIFPELHGMHVYAQQAIQTGQQSGYAFPLVTDGAELGHLYFTQQPANTRSLDLLSPLLSSQVLLLLSQEELRVHAATDPLTGLRNRRGLASKGKRLLKLASLREKPVSVAILDLDHFKRVNDAHGHAVGDRALKALAEILIATTRDNDMAVRWGGEEFVLVLYDTDLGAARRVLERIRKEMRGRKIEPIAWPLTLSVGLTGGRVPTESLSLTAWIDLADSALLHAKEKGRDRIEIAQRERQTLS